MTGCVEGAFQNGPSDDRQVGQPITPSVLSADPSVPGVAGSGFDYGVNFGNDAGGEERHASARELNARLRRTVPLDTMIRLLLALVLGLAQAAGAADYHVAMTRASDANPCTDASRCLTIARGLEVAGAGDTLWIHGGVWTTAITTETMAITGGSSWATQLLVAEWPGETVIIRPASGTRVLYLADEDASYIEFRDIDFDAVNVTSDAVKLTASFTASHHIRLRGGSVKNAGDGVLRGDDLEQGILVTNGADSNEFIGVEVAYNGEASNRDHGFYIATDDNLVDGCHVHHNAAVGVQIVDVGADGDPDRNVVRNSDIHDNGQAGPTGEGITVCGADNRIERNYSHDNQAAGILVYDVDGVCDAINTTVRSNWLTGNGGEPITVYPTAVGTVESGNFLFAPVQNESGGTGAAGEIPR